VPQSDLDKTTAARGVDLANIAADKAVVASRQLDLEYTQVKAPVSGRVSRYVVTVGNLIQSGDQGGGTLLTTIVSVDPIYVYFDVDEHTVLRVRQMIREGNPDASTLDNAIQKARYRLNAAARLLLSHRGTHEDFPSPQITATYLSKTHHRSGCASCLLAGCGFVGGNRIRGESAEI